MMPVGAKEVSAKQSRGGSESEEPEEGERSETHGHFDFFIMTDNIGNSWQFHVCTIFQRACNGRCRCWHIIKIAAIASVFRKHAPHRVR